MNLHDRVVRNELLRGIHFYDRGRRELDDKLGVDDVYYHGVPLMSTESSLSSFTSSPTTIQPCAGLHTFAVMPDLHFYC